MDKQPFSSLSLAFQDGSQSRISTRSAAAKKHNSDVTKNLLSAQIEDNLSRLLECLKLEYGKQILVSPKWKNFGSQKLQFAEKTRLNNAIWRCWHIQYLKNKKPLFCQFVSPLSSEREPPKKPLTVVLQGRYWRRKLDAIAREYKKWRIYYKNKNQGLDDSFERSRSYSTSSTGDDEAAHGSPLTQVAGLMDLELTTDLVHSHPDTLFTTKTEPIPKPNVSEIVYQPTLDSLQPNLDEFTKHLESLVDGMVQSDDSIQLTNSFLAQHEQQDTSLPSYQDQQEQMDMMEDSNDYNHMYSMCSTSSALNTSQTQPFIDATEPFTQFPMDYNNQMEIQTYETSPMSQPLSESLTELEEEPEQEIFPSKSIASPIQIPQSTPSSTQLPTHQQATSHTVHHGQLPYRHSTSNLQEYGTSPTRKGRLPRNVSDNQLSMIDHSQLNYNLHFGSPTERKIPAKEQFPNLVAYLQSHNGNTESTASQAKRPRIPRNMSDSRLYNTSNMNLNYLQNIASGNSQQTPLDQIQAQSQRQQTTLNTTTHLTSKQRGRKGKLPRNMSDSSLMYMNQQQLHMPVSQPSTQRRKSLETKSAMSPPSSLQSAHPVFSSTLAAAHEVNQAMRQEAAAATRVAITTTAVGPSQTFDQSSLMDQLVQLPQGASLLKTTNQQKYTHPSSSAQTGQTVLSQLLLQGETTIPQKQDSEGNYVVKQVLDLLQKQVPQSKQVSCPEVSSTWKGPSANQQQPSELMSLLQDSPQGSMVTSNTITDQPDLQKQMSLQHQQHAQPLQQQQQQQISPHQQLQQLSLEPHQHLPLQQQELQQQLLQLQSQQQKLPKHSPQPAKEKGESHPVQQHLHQFIQQQQQLKQQLQQNQHSSQLISALQSTNNALQQHLFPQQKVPTVQQPQNLQQAQHQVQQSRHPQEEVKLQQKHQQQLLHQQPQQHVQQLQHQQQLQQQQLQHQHQQLQQQHQEQQQLQQQHQHLLPQQGIVYADNQPVPKMTPINIQPKPQSQNLPAGQAATIMITPQPLSAQTGVQAQAQPVTLGSLPVNLLPLQQIISGNPGTQVVLPVPFKLSSTNPLSLSASTSQQTKGINSTVDSLSQTLFATHTTTAAATSTMTATVTTCGSTCSSSEFSFSSIPLTTSATRKFSRPVAVADREHYKEHRRQSHISAEQKRRFNIKVGFDQLVGMVPSLASQKNSKVSKATILQKSYEFIAKLQREREKVHEEQEMLKKESQQLFASISQCQQKLPAFGVPLNKQRADQMMALFNQYVKGRSQDNYKFWILAVMFRQMFESYNQKVSSATWEEFCTSILSWMDKQCTLPTLRPAVLSALRDISRTTSILTDPSMVPQEIQRRVAAYEDPTNLSETNRSSSSGAATNFFHSSSS